jgi:hypothetical protein
MNEFRLTGADIANPLWIKLRKHFDDRIQKHREDNDATKTPEATEKLRGRISELKQILKLESAATAPDK